MNTLLLLSEAGQTGNTKLIVEILVVVLCLFSPYLIHRYTGKSMAEWMSLNTVAGWIKKRKDKKHPQKPSAASIAKKAADPNLKNIPATEKIQNASSSEPSAKAASKAAAGTDRNSNKGDLSKFIMDLLSFVRKHKMFLLLPGGVQYGNEIASLTAIIVTKKGVIGVNTFGFGGIIQVRMNEATWVQRLNTVPKEFKNPTIANEANARILKGALESAGFGNVPVETAEVFTSPTLSLKGAKAKSVYTRNSFFETLASPEYNQGTIDPKAVGKALDQMIPKVKQSKKK